MDEKNKAILICGFPGIGKTTLAHLIKSKYKNINVIDSEELHIDNRTFPISYVDNIIAKMSNNNTIILSSSHPKVIEELTKRKIWFTVYYPNVKRKKEFIEIYKMRHDSQSFIDYISYHFNSMIDLIDNNQNCNKIKLNNVGEYISNNSDLLTLLKNLNSK